MQNEDTTNTEKEAEKEKEKEKDEVGTKTGKETEADKTIKDTKPDSDAVTPSVLSDDSRTSGAVVRTNAVVFVGLCFFVLVSM